MDYGTCKRCRQQIRWARSAAKGTPMPLDEDDERGNVVVDGYGRAHVFADHDAARAAMEADARTYGIGATFIAHHAAGQCAAAPAREPRRDAAVAVPLF